MRTPYMDGRGAVHFPGGEHDSPRMGDSLVRSADSVELEKQQEQDLIELETAERRKIAKDAINQMLERFDEWYCDEELRENRG